VTDDISAFSCPPKKQATCEHVWDGPGLIFFSQCFECEGVGIVPGPDGKDAFCPKCEGKGELECGGASTCSKCGMNAMTYSLWNDE
jgi:hypothetical protein